MRGIRIKYWRDVDVICKNLEWRWWFRKSAVKDLLREKINWYKYKKNNRMDWRKYSINFKIRNRKLNDFILPKKFEINPFTWQWY